MKIKNIFIGGWFQRTSLHLSEIYDFFREADSPLDLDKQKLGELQANLGIKKLELTVDDFEYIAFRTASGIDIKIYEDGVMMLGTKPGREIKDDIALLTSYYEEKLSPALRYIFSLGAPVPKELANIQTIYPYFVVLEKAKRTDAENLLNAFGEKKHFEIVKKDFEIYRGKLLYIINNITQKPSTIEQFIQEQIFIREFKGQMHRYLNIHRQIWEKIADVKERGKIRGSEMGPFFEKIESYSKTINLIEARINQMDTYIRTREAIFKLRKELSKFIDVLQFKYETLADTLEYIKDIWAMTKNYVTSSLELFSNLQAQSTRSSVSNLTVVTSMGVGASLLSLFTQEPPSFTPTGITYFFTLALVGYLTNRIMRHMAMNKMYAIQDVEAAKDLK